MNGKLFLALVSFCSLALSACGLQTDVTQRMDREGNARMVVVFGPDAGSPDISETCDVFLSETLWKSPHCSVEDGRAIMGGIVSLKNAPEYAAKRSVPYNTYKYDVNAVHKILSGMGGEEADTVSLGTGGKTAYVIEMPGEIVRTDVGVINANKAEIDVEDLAGKGHAYIESRELNVSWMIGLASFIPIMLFVSYVAGRKQKKRDY